MLGVEGDGRGVMRERYKTVYTRICGMQKRKQCSENANQRHGSTLIQNKFSKPAQAWAVAHNCMSKL